MSQAQIEQYLKDYYGQAKVCWLTGGIAGDDTDGHVDDLARFIGPRKVVIAMEEDPKDENYKVLREVRRQLDYLPRSGWKTVGNRRNSHARLRRVRRAAIARQLT